MLGQAFRYVVIALLPGAAAAIALVNKQLLDESVALFLAFAGGVGCLLIILMLLDRWHSLKQQIDDIFHLTELGLPNTTDLSPHDKLLAVMEHRLSNEQQQALQLIAWQDLFERLPDALLMLDHATKVVSANSMARKIFGQHLNGKALSSMMRHPQALKAVDIALNDDLQHSVDFVLGTIHEKHYRLVVEAVPENPYTKTRLLVTLQDQSSSRQAERSHADFVAYASHELRTPLTALLGFIETLQGPAKDDAEARAQFLGIMFEQASRMSRLINDLLSLSRIEQKLMKPAEDYLNLSPLLKSTVEALSVKAEAKGMRIRLTTPETALTLQGEADELTQLFQNLVDNAIKYGAENTEISVIATPCESVPYDLNERPETFAVVRISNHGDGIASDELPRLTERFYRTRSARAKSDTGTGLGLAIVKNIIAHHKGLLDVESDLGGVTTFSAYLPLAEEN